jgi:hypothetical protein
LLGLITAWTQYRGGGSYQNVIGLNLDPDAVLSTHYNGENKAKYVKYDAEPESARATLKI